MRYSIHVEVKDFPSIMKVQGIYLTLSRLEGGQAVLLAQVINCIEGLISRNALYY